MKKIIALMMSVAMMAVTLAGCSDAELGFLDQLQKLNMMEEGTFSNSLEVYINKSAMQEFLADVRDQMEEEYGALQESDFAEPEWWQDTLDDVLEELPDETLGALDPELEAELEALLIKFGTEDTLSDEEFARLEELLYGEYDELDYYDLAGVYYSIWIPVLDSALNALEAMETDEFHIEFAYTVERREGDDRGMKIVASLTLNGRAVDLGEIYVDSDYNIYLSARTIGAYRELLQYVPWGDEVDGMLEAMEALAQEHKYIRLEGESGFVFVPEGMYHDSIVGELTGLVGDFYTEAFSGFTTRAVRKTYGGYELEITLEDAVKLLDKAAGYALDNEEQFFGAYDEYTGNIGNLLQNPGFSTAVVDIPKLSDSEKVDYREALTQTRTEIQTQLKSDWMNAVKRSKMRVFLKTSGGSRIAEMEIMFNYNGSKAFALTVNSTAKEGRPEIRYPSKYISGDEMRNRLEILERELNPSVGAEMYFDFYGEGEENPEKELAVWQLLTTNFGDYYEMDYLELNGQYYVPLRAMAEPLQLELTYDQKVKRSQPVIDGKTVEMGGVVENNVFYVALADFEQLGFLVEARDDGHGGVVILNKKLPAWEEWYDYLLSGG